MSCSDLHLTSRLGLCSDSMMWEDVGVMWESPPWEHLHEAPTFWSPHGGVCVCARARRSMDRDVHTQALERTCWHYSTDMDVHIAESSHALSLQSVGNSSSYGRSVVTQDRCGCVCMPRKSKRRAECCVHKRASAWFIARTLACHQAEPSGALAS